jgi:hypothetical protein
MGHAEIGTSISAPVEDGALIFLFSLLRRFGRLVRFRLGLILTVSEAIGQTSGFLFFRAFGIGAAIGTAVITTGRGDSRWGYGC